MREIGAFGLVVAMLALLIWLWQARSTVGEYQEQQGTIVSMTTWYSKAYLYPRSQATVKLDNDKLISVAIPHDGTRCQRGDRLIIRQYEKRFFALAQTCQRQSAP
jgi:hypothetical protein